MDKTNQIKEIKEKIAVLSQEEKILGEGMPELAKKVKKIAKMIETDYSLAYELETIAKNLVRAREERIRIRSEKWMYENTLKELEKGDN